MNKIEAYSILTSELETMSKFPKQELRELTKQTIETEFKTKEGILYTINIIIREYQGNSILLVGKIHDNNSFNFELLEESLVIEA